jgi:hypothetical protein
MFLRKSVHLMRSKFGRRAGSKVLTWTPIEVGEPGTGQVRLRQSAAGLTYIDVYHRAGMTATLAGAQTVEVKKKPPLYTYVSYWEFPRAHWREVDKDNATGNQKLLAPALADGTLVGYGDDANQVHYSAEGFTHNNWWQANSVAGLMKVLEAFRKGGGSSSPLLVSSTKHWDQMFISRFYNWKAGSWKDAYGYTGTYKLKPDAPDPDDAVQTLSSFYVPVFEKLLADGTIVEYEIARETLHSTDARTQIRFSFVMPSAEGLDKWRAVLLAALSENSLIGPAFGSMMVSFAPQSDYVRVNAPYK